MSRKYCGRTQVSTKTEYQDRFLPPHCYLTIFTSTNKNPYHSLKGTSADISTFKYVTYKWMKTPTKVSQPALPPKFQPRCSSAPNPHTRFVENQEDYTSVYKNDFQAWKANKRQPYRLQDSLKVNQGLVVPKNASKETHSQRNSFRVDANCKPAPQEQEPQPFESMTSYRCDYIPHQVQPRRHRMKPMNRNNTALPSERAESFGPKLAYHKNQELLNEASKFFEQFKTWSLETNFHGQGKAKVSSPPADRHGFLSITHADYTPHEYQHTKPVLPSVQSSEKIKEPFPTLTTMKEDYKAWNTPRRMPIINKDQMEWPKKTPIKVCTLKPAESCKTNPKLSSLHSNQEETPVHNSNCDATEKHQSAGENGVFSTFRCISTGDEETRMLWSTCFDKKGAWLDNDICEDDTDQTQQIISTMVASQS
ncbi:stabilizer of axonemal microtubules 2 [Echeneis naucrates]|uniref:stabilizer of axonemal microtubules 2 n=1 Tax=Echeneis naucrates TaxID=173247 RepID=UPI001114382E|nr:stabilizer of axonemal microtubules 2 [Echeneis naucrates]